MTMLSGPGRFSRSSTFLDFQDLQRLLGYFVTTLPIFMVAYWYHFAYTIKVLGLDLRILLNESANFATLIDSLK